MHREPHLLLIVGAGTPTGRLTGTLHGWQQQADEHGDDCDNDEQFHERETATPRGGIVTTEGLDHGMDSGEAGRTNDNHAFSRHETPT